VEEATFDSNKGNLLAVGGWRNKFKRGDANGSGVVDISDPIAISNWLYQSAAAPACLDGADANDDGFVDETDRDYIFNYLFSGGPAPVDPHQAMVALLLARAMVDAANRGRVVSGAELEAVLA
jgi:hypothetical protein